MGLNDWNNNGKYDMFDQMTDYKLVNDSLNTNCKVPVSQKGKKSGRSNDENTSAPSENQKNGKEYHMSTLGALLCSIGGFMFAAVVNGATSNGLPAIVLVIIWLAFSMGLAILFGYR